MERDRFDRDERARELDPMTLAIEAEREYELARSESLISSAQETRKERPRDVPLHQLRDRSGMYEERGETERWDNTSRLLELREVQLIGDTCVGLRAESWQYDKRKDRVETLQSVEAVLAECQFREEARVGVLWSPFGFARSDTEKRIIQISALLLAQEHPFRALKSLFHEARHCYQYHVIDRKGEHREISLDQRIYLLKGANSYPHGTPRTRAAFEKYHYNQLEVDARRYADRQLGRFLDMLKHEHAPIAGRHD